MKYRCIGSEFSIKELESVLRISVRFYLDKKVHKKIKQEYATKGNDIIIDLLFMDNRHHTQPNYHIQWDLDLSESMKKRKETKEEFIDFYARQVKGIINNKAMALLDLRSEDEGLRLLSLIRLKLIKMKLLKEGKDERKSSDS